MTIGPLQIVLILLDDRKQSVPISKELLAVRKQGIIRLVDLLYVAREQDGTLRSKEVSDLSEVEKVEYGVMIRGLLEMRAAENTDASVNALAEKFDLTGSDFGLSKSDIPKIAERISTGGSALLALFEHTWAISLKEAVIKSGGEVVAQGLLSPSALAIGGTTLEEAMANAQKIETLADQHAAEKLAEAENFLAEAQTQAAALDAEAHLTLDQAVAEAQTRIEQARIVASANIAASVRVASEELQEADQKLEMSKEEAKVITQVGIDMADQILAEGETAAAAAIASGQQIAEEEIVAGIQTAEEIKTAAVMESLKLLVQAKLIREGATQEALSMLVTAAMIEGAAIQDAERYLLE